MSLGCPLALPWGKSNMRLGVSLVLTYDAPFVATAAELWTLHASRLLAPVLDPPCLRLKVFNLETKIRHVLGGKRLGCELVMCQQVKRSLSLTLGSSSTSIGAGLSSIMMSVTSDWGCAGGGCCD